MVFTGVAVAAVGSGSGSGDGGFVATSILANLTTTVTSITFDPLSTVTLVFSG